MNIINTLQQENSPLSDLFFSEFNINLVQKAIRQGFYDKTGLAIDRQNQFDLLTIMRSVYITNSMEPNKELCEQVKWMNTKTINIALGQIETGVAQQIDYFRDASRLAIPNALPKSTSVYGKKIDLNTKIGF